MKLESFHSSEDKKKWKIVRLDNHTDVPGEIVAADEDTGEYSMSVPNPDGSGVETKTGCCSAGIALIKRGR
jgi:hypothetical protein